MCIQHEDGALKIEIDVGRGTQCNTININFWQNKIISVRFVRTELRQLIPNTLIVVRNKQDRRSHSNGKNETRRENNSTIWNNYYKENHNNIMIASSNFYNISNNRSKNVANEKRREKIVQNRD